MMILPGGPVPPGGHTVLRTRWSAQMEQAMADIQRYNQQRACSSAKGYILPSGLTLVHAIQAMAHALESEDYMEGDTAMQQELRDAMEALLKPLRYNQDLLREKRILHLHESMLPASRRRRRREHHAALQQKKGKSAKKKPLSPFLTNKDARQMVVLLYLLFDPEDETLPDPPQDDNRSCVSSDASIAEEEEVNAGRERSQVDV